MPSIEDLYQNILGRASDAEGLQFWTNALNNGVSYDSIQQQFYASDEYRNLQATAPAATSNPVSTEQIPRPAPQASGTTSDPYAAYGGTFVNQYGKTMVRNPAGFDTGGMSYDEFRQQWVDQTGGTSRYAEDGSTTHYGTLNVGGTSYDAQWVVDGATWKNGRTGGNVWDAGAEEVTYNPSAVITDPTDSGYNLGFYRNEDGSLGVARTQKNDNFLGDLAMFALTAVAMYYGVNALGTMAGGSAAAGTVAAPGGVATGASAAGEMSLADAMATYAPDFAAETAAAGMGDAGISAGLTEAAATESVANTGFQAAHLTAPWESVPTDALGSGLHGVNSVDGLLKLGTVGADGSFSLGGMTLLPDGSVISAGDLFGASAPWINPGSSTITDIVVNSAGSVGDLMAGVDPWSQFVAGMGDVLSPSPVGPTGAAPDGGAPGQPDGGTPPTGGTNWWDNLGDIATGIAAGTVADSVLNGNTPAVQTSPNVTINIPKPNPSAAALQPASSQRAGVRFGRTKSKRQLKGKFSGTGLTLG